MGPRPSQIRTSEQKQENERRWREWVRGELAAGVTPLALTAQMVKRGWPRERATLLISSNVDAVRPARVVPLPPVMPNLPPSAPPRNPYTRHLFIGGTICAVGIAVTVGTMVLSGSRGGPVVIAWGAIVFGALEFFGGAVGYVRYRR